MEFKIDVYFQHFCIKFTLKIVSSLPTFTLYQLTMKSSTLIYFIFFETVSCLATNYTTNFTLPTIRFRIKSIKCDADDEVYMGHGTMNCSVKPTRDGSGLTTIMYNFRKPVYDAWFHLYILYKFTGQYRQWMFNIDEDVCAFTGGTAPLGRFMSFVVPAIKSVEPSLVHPCPYSGILGLNARNIDKIVSRSIPQIVPRGDYRIVLRFHTKANRTFINVVLGGVIEAINAIDNISMG